MNTDIVVEVPKACEHGHRGYCGFCEAKNAPKCEKHGRPWYCGQRGPQDARHVPEVNPPPSITTA